LLGVSAYSVASPNVIGASPEMEQSIRRSLGGQIAPPAVSQTRWYLKDLERAEHAADMGDLSSAARLMRAARGDGVFSGVLSTRTGGLVRLPKKFRGDPEIIEALQVGHDTVRSVFDEMFPAAELALLAADGLLLGVGVGELLPVEGREHPVFCRLDPEFLLYRWTENRWYYRSVAGLIPITPGDGRWILHTPGGRLAPWQNGLWRAIGRAYIRKEHAQLHKDNWEAKLANPARVAVAPQGSSELQKQSWFRAVMAWGVNTVFGMSPGYDVKLIESNGRGHEYFEATIVRQDRAGIIAIAWLEVTTDGGAGFQNSDIHKSIRSDLIKETADGLAHTLNTQGIPPYIVSRWGIDALDRSSVMEWDVTPPKDLNSSATAYTAIAGAIRALTLALGAHGRELDIDSLCSDFSVPIIAAGDEQGTETASLVLAPADLASVITVNEARDSQGLDPLTLENGEPDPDGDLTVAEFREQRAGGGLSLVKGTAA